MKEAFINDIWHLERACVCLQRLCW